MKLSEEQLEIISKAAAQAVYEYLEKEKQKQKKDKQDHRLHNIKLLLQNYRGLVLHCETLKAELTEIDSTSIQDLDVSTISVESIESIKRSREKSIAMVLFIQGKMNAYRQSCNEEEMKYFRVLEKKYLTTKRFTIKEIAKTENIDRTTVYRYIDKAVEDLPIIFFGVAAIDFK
ncbi:hypothetical protein J7E79_02770 [Bacillus sp. ISL-40]|uniref:hypothetical protein n=1 Tax=unclassified Bacillus (in: firmicutes) TaxID=185979 RepID=UPI001BE71A7B|nr:MULTISPECIES: hypothetical protein [unclassified Bacillus (in: firmicutes)]MBT2696359.1 hypothetical protein [Bacillus sp. ISL-40]MBT2743208.1 hypothetical protein [Bacillus sp. ISL-77]